MCRWRLFFLLYHLSSAAEGSSEESRLSKGEALEEVHVQVQVARLSTKQIRIPWPELTNHERICIEYPEENLKKDETNFFLSFDKVGVDVTSWRTTTSFSFEKVKSEAEIKNCRCKGPCFHRENAAVLEMILVTLRPGKFFTFFSLHGCYQGDSGHVAPLANLKIVVESVENAFGFYGFVLQGEGRKETTVSIPLKHDEKDIDYRKIEVSSPDIHLSISHEQIEIEVPPSNRTRKVFLCLHFFLEKAQRTAGSELPIIKNDAQSLEAINETSAFEFLIPILMFPEPKHEVTKDRKKLGSIGLRKSRRKAVNFGWITDINTFDSLPISGSYADDSGKIDTKLVNSSFSEAFLTLRNVKISHLYPEEQTNRNFSSLPLVCYQNIFINAQKMEVETANKKNKYENNFINVYPMKYERILRFSGQFKSHWICRDFFRENGRNGLFISGLISLPGQSSSLYIPFFLKVFFGFIFFPFPEEKLMYSSRFLERVNNRTLSNKNRTETRDKEERFSTRKKGLRKGLLYSFDEKRTQYKNMEEFYLGSPSISSTFKRNIQIFSISASSYFSFECFHNFPRQKCHFPVTITPFSVLENKLFFKVKVPNQKVRVQTLKKRIQGKMNLEFHTSFGRLSVLVDFSQPKLECSLYGSKLVGSIYSLSCFFVGPQFASCFSSPPSLKVPLISIGRAYAFPFLLRNKEGGEAVDLKLLPSGREICGLFAGLNSDVSPSSPSKGCGSESLLLASQQVVLEPGATIMLKVQVESPHGSSSGHFTSSLQIEVIIRGFEKTVKKKFAVSISYLLAEGYVRLDPPLVSLPLPGGRGERRGKKAGPGVVLPGSGGRGEGGTGKGNEVTLVNRFPIPVLVNNVSSPDPRVEVETLTHEIPPKEGVPFVRVKLNPYALPLEMERIKKRMDEYFHHHLSKEKQKLQVCPFSFPESTPFYSCEETVLEDSSFFRELRQILDPPGAKQLIFSRKSLEGEVEMGEGGLWVWKVGEDGQGLTDVLLLGPSEISNSSSTVRFLPSPNDPRGLPLREQDRNKFALVGCLAWDHLKHEYLRSLEQGKLEKGHLTVETSVFSPPSLQYSFKLKKNDSWVGSVFPPRLTPPSISLGPFHSSASSSDVSIVVSNPFASSIGVILSGVDSPGATFGEKKTGVIPPYSRRVFSFQAFFSFVGTRSFLFLLQNNRTVCEDINLDVSVQDLQLVDSSHSLTFTIFGSDFWLADHHRTSVEVSRTFRIESEESSLSSFFFDLETDSGVGGCTSSSGFSLSPCKSSSSWESWTDKEIKLTYSIPLPTSSSPLQSKVWPDIQPEQILLRVVSESHVLRIPIIIDGTSQMPRADSSPDLFGFSHWFSFMTLILSSSLMLSLVVLQGKRLRECPSSVNESRSRRLLFSIQRERKRWTLLKEKHGLREKEEREKQERIRLQQAAELNEQRKVAKKRAKEEEPGNCQPPVCPSSTLSPGEAVRLSEGGSEQKGISLGSKHPQEFEKFTRSVKKEKFKGKAREEESSWQGVKGQKHVPMAVPNPLMLKGGRRKERWKKRRNDPEAQQEKPKTYEVQYEEGEGSKEDGSREDEELQLSPSPKESEEKTNEPACKDIKTSDNEMRKFGKARVLLKGPVEDLKKSEGEIVAELPLPKVTGLQRNERGDAAGKKKQKGGAKEDPGGHREANRTSQRNERTKKVEGAQEWRKRNSTRKRNMEKPKLESKKTPEEEKKETQAGSSKVGSRLSPFESFPSSMPFKLTESNSQRVQDARLSPMYPLVKDLSQGEVHNSLSPSLSSVFPTVTRELEMEVEKGEQISELPPFFAPWIGNGGWRLEISSSKSEVQFDGAPKAIPEEFSFPLACSTKAEDKLPSYLSRNLHDDLFKPRELEKDRDGAQFANFNLWSESEKPTDLIEPLSHAPPFARSVQSVGVIGERQGAGGVEDRGRVVGEDGWEDDAISLLRALPRGEVEVLSPPLSPDHLFPTSLRRASRSPTQPDFLSAIHELTGSSRRVSGPEDQKGPVLSTGELLNEDSRIEVPSPSVLCKAPSFKLQLLPFIDAEGRFVPSQRSSSLKVLRGQKPPLHAVQAPPPMGASVFSSAQPVGGKGQGKGASMRRGADGRPLQTWWV